MKDTTRARTVWDRVRLNLTILAIRAPLISGLAVTVMVAFLITAAGVAQAVYALIAERKQTREIDELEA